MKGSIAPGKHADLMVWDPSSPELDTDRHMFPLISPVRGLVLFGKVQRTYLRGKLVFIEGKYF
jgi:dihydroorotase-like cyclic amidohydrolase